MGDLAKLLAAAGNASRVITTIQATTSEKNSITVPEIAGKDSFFIVYTAEALGTGNGDIHYLYKTPDSPGVMRYKYGSSMVERVNTDDKYFSISADGTITSNYPAFGKSAYLCITY